jgi:hypothetical protein
MFDLEGAGRRKLLYTKKLSRKGFPLRSFKAVSMKNKPISGGPYYGRNPKQAAAKAFSWYCRKSNRTRACAGTIKIQETTRGNPKTLYGYNAAREFLRGNEKGYSDKDGVQVVYNYNSKLYSTRK